MRNLVAGVLLVSIVGVGSAWGDAAVQQLSADLDGSLEGFFNPALTAPERMVAGVEGWILGVQ